MVQVHIDDAVLRQAAAAGMDNFLEAFAGAIREAIGGELNADNMVSSIPTKSRCLAI